MASHAFEHGVHVRHGERAVGGPARKFYSREEADQLAARARADGEAKARQTAEAKGFASVDRIVAHLSPVSAQLAQLADTLRREAAELALIAATQDRRRRARPGRRRSRRRRDRPRRCSMLKNNPAIAVTLAPDALPEVERRMEQLRRQGARREHRPSSPTPTRSRATGASNGPKARSASAASRWRPRSTPSSRLDFKIPSNRNSNSFPPRRNAP